MKKKTPANDEIMEMIDRINRKLDAVEELMAWVVLAKQRFTRGQRVQFNDKARRSGITRGRRGHAAKGRVVKLGESFSMDVLLDGYKHPRGFHHSFFDPVGRAGKGGKS